MKVRFEDTLILSSESSRKSEKNEEGSKRFNSKYSVPEILNEENFLDTLKYINTQAMKLKDSFNVKHNSCFDPAKIHTKLSGKKIKEAIVHEQFQPRNIIVNSNVLKEVRASRQTFYTNINRNKECIPYEQKMNKKNFS